MTHEAYFFSLWFERGKERMKFYLKSMKEWCPAELLALKAMLALAED